MNKWQNLNTGEPGGAFDAFGLLNIFCLPGNWFMTFYINMFQARSVLE